MFRLIYRRDSAGGKVSAEAIKLSQQASFRFSQPAPCSQNKTASTHLKSIEFLFQFVKVFFSLLKISVHGFQVHVKVLRRLFAVFAVAVVSRGASTPAASSVLALQK